MVEVHRIRTDGGVVEIEAAVQWALTPNFGNRFFHVRHSDDAPPTISEAIDMPTLVRISGGKQALRGFALLGSIELVLEVWSDVDTEIASDFDLTVALIPR